MLKKPIIFWTIAVLITAAAILFQRRTGPTYPIYATIDLNETEYSLELPTSHGEDSDSEVRLAIPDEKISGELFYRRYNTDDQWTAVSFSRDGEELLAKLPQQPPAGKLEYYVTLTDGEKNTTLGEKNHIVIRFKRGVSPFIWVPHVVIIFAAMLFSNLAGITSAIGEEKYKLFTYIALGLLFAGGMILGPIMQYIAFGQFWTGIPFGWDLTDNKTLIAILAYVFAIFGNFNKERRYLVVVAAVITLVVFFIPHSLFGSELDYSTGVVKTG